MNNGGMREVVALVLLSVLGIAGLVAMSARADAATSGESGAQMSSNQASRSNALECTGDLTTGPRPVLLVHGTALTAAENWSTSYLPALVTEGHAVCTVSVPGTATGDLQGSVEYVATAIRTMNTHAGRKISVVGHSQGAYLPRVALKVWPDLADRVDDVIGLAGVYDRGSDELLRRCATACVPAMHQMATGSRLGAALQRRDLPAGPSYTNIGTLGDTTVTPQPAANQQAGATAIEIQDVCPGRTIPLSEHGLIVGDAVAFALVLDALGHDGAAASGRVSRETCDEVYYTGFVPNPFLEAAPFVRERLRTTTTAEAALRCHLKPTCADVDARGRLLESARVAVTGTSVTWTGRVPLDGAVRVTFRGKTYTRRVSPGTLTFRVNRPRGATGTMTLQTRPDRYTAWATESTVRLT